MKKAVAFTRRRFLGASLAAAAMLQFERLARGLATAPAPDEGACRLAAEQESGPFYVADELLRSDIVEGRPGVPLALRIVVLDARTCVPLAHAAVDLWHCDALGLYSGFTRQNPMGPPDPQGPGGPPPGFDPRRLGGEDGPPGDMGPPPGSHPSDKLTFLRGIQLTGPDGTVNFRTIFPGFYMGRTNHVHFKVRVGGHAAKSYEAGHTAHVGQIFFPEEISARLMRREPYNRHKIHRTTQAEDHVFRGQHGSSSIARIEPVEAGDPAAGLRAALVVALDPTATPAPVRGMGGPGGPPFS